MQLRATRRSTQKFDPTVADVEQKERRTQDRRREVSSISLPLTRRTARQGPTFVPYNPHLPPAAFPTLDWPRSTYGQIQVTATSADQDSRSPSATPSQSPSEVSPQQPTLAPYYEPSRAWNMVQNESWNWRDFYPPVSMPEATDYLDFPMFQDSSVLHIRPQRPSNPHVCRDVSSTNQEPKGASTPARVDLGATNGPDTALLQRNRELINIIDDITRDDLYQAEMVTSDEEVPPPIKRHKVRARKPTQSGGH